MLPSSWHREIEKAVREASSSDDEKWNAAVDRQNISNALIAEQIGSFADNFRSYKEQQNTDDKKERTLNKITILLVFLTVLFTGGSWWEFKGQLDEMRKASEQTEKAMISSGRAWVGVAGAKITGSISKGNDAKIVTSTRNSGREPAINFTWDMVPIVTAFDDGTFDKRVDSYVQSCFQRPSKKGSQVLYPSTGFGTGFDFTTEVAKDVIDDEVVAGRKIIGVLGCLVYDSFEKTRHSTFCYFYKNGTTPADNLNICAGGTYAD